MSDATLYVDSRYLSPYAFSAFVALTEKGVKFTVAEVDLVQGDNRKADFAQLSKTSRIPVLQQQGFYVSESSAIIEYVDEAFAGAPLYPHALQEKAQARQIQAWLRTDLPALRQERPTEVIYYQPTATPLSEAAKQAAEKLFFVANGFLQHGKNYLFGEWSIVDVELALMLNRLVANGDAVPANLAAYVATQWARPSVQRWVKHNRPPL